MDRIAEVRSMEKIDADKASSLVKKYFETMAGNLGLLRFLIESAILDEDRDIWIIRCSFFPSFGSAKRVNYEVEVNAKTGSFGLVKKIE